MPFRSGRITRDMIFFPLANFRKRVLIIIAINDLASLRRHLTRLTTILWVECGGHPMVWPLFYLSTAIWISWLNIKVPLQSLHQFLMGLTVLCSCTTFFSVVFKIDFWSNINVICIRYRSTGKLFSLRHFRDGSMELKTLVKSLHYTEDCDSVAHTQCKMQKLMHCHSEGCRTFGLTISMRNSRPLSACTRQEFLKSCYICVWEAPQSWFCLTWYNTISW